MEKVGAQRFITSIFNIPWSTFDILFSSILRRWIKKGPNGQMSHTCCVTPSNPEPLVCYKAMIGGWNVAVRL